MTTSPAGRTPREPGHLVRLVHNRLGASAVVDAVMHPDGDRFTVAPERLVELMAFLKRDPDADLQLLVQLVALDLGPTTAPGEPRFEVIYHLRSPRLGYRALVMVRVQADDPSVPSLTPLYAAAEPLERELHEMTGVYPEGHPKLRPLLLYAGFEGHPLRKDFEAGGQHALVAAIEHERPVVFDDKAEPPPAPLRALRGTDGAGP